MERLEWKEQWQWDTLPVSERPALSWEEWRKRLAQRPKTNTVTSAAAALEEARQEREAMWEQWFEQRRADGNSQS